MQGLSSLVILIIFSTFCVLVITDDTATAGVAAHDEAASEDSWLNDHDHEDVDFSSFFSDDNTEDNEHLEHHLKEDIGLEKSVENMTESERDWYYFKLHDADGDFRLDGLEIFKAWQHHYLEHMGHEGMDHAHNSTEQAQKWMEEQNESFVSMVDMILEHQDTNKDGYMDYYEYMMAKSKSREEEAKHKAETEAKEKEKEKEHKK